MGPNLSVERRRAAACTRWRWPSGIARTGTARAAAGRLETAAAGHVLACPDCGTQQFPRTDPAVIMLVTDGEIARLLGRQPSWPEGRYSTLAGFVEPGEALEQAVRARSRRRPGSRSTT